MQAEWICIACLVLLVDQASKNTVLKRFAAGRLSAGGRGALIRVVPNPRMGLGLFRSRCPLVVIWCLSAAGIALIPHTLTLSHGVMFQLGAGAALGGAGGNLLDLLRHGAVVDFIDLRIWPVFNLADTAVLSGVTLACLALLGA